MLLSQDNFHVTKIEYTDYALITQLLQFCYCKHGRCAFSIGTSPATEITIDRIRSRILQKGLCGLHCMSCYRNPFSSRADTLYRTAYYR